MTTQNDADRLVSAATAAANAKRHRIRCVRHRVMGRPRRRAARHPYPRLTKGGSYSLDGSALRGAGQDACPDGPDRFDPSVDEHLRIILHKPPPLGATLPGRPTIRLS